MPLRVVPEGLAARSVKALIKEPQPIHPTQYLLGSALRVARSMEHRLLKTRDHLIHVKAPRVEALNVVFGSEGIPLGDLI